MPWFWMFLTVLKPFKKNVRKLQLKKIGSRRLVLAVMNISTADSSHYYWKPGWTIGNPRFIGSPAPGTPDRHLAQYWDRAWHDILTGKPTHTSMELQNKDLTVWFLMALKTLECTSLPTGRRESVASACSLILDAVNLPVHGILHNNTRSSGYCGALNWIASRLS